MDEYLLENHQKDIKFILSSPGKSQKYEVKLNLSLLLEKNEKLFNRLSLNFDKEAGKWKSAIIKLQTLLNEDETGSIKNFVDIIPCSHPNVNIKNFKINPDKNLFKLVAFRATIVKKHQVRQRIVTKKFMCNGCRKVTIVKANRLLGYGFSHDRCTEHILEDVDSNKISICQRRVLPCKYTDKKFIKTLITQRYEVTVPHLENLKSFGDKTYYIDVEGSLINAFEANTIVDIIGIIKTRGTKGYLTKMKKFNVFALNMEPIESIQKDLTLSIQRDLMTQWLEDISNNSEMEVRNQIIHCAFPNFVGANAIKLAILLTICSGCGLAKNETKELENRDVFHLMLAGKENAGKRTLLKAATQLCAKSNEVMCYGLTTSSLTASTLKLKKVGTSGIEAGVLMRANESISCFYEFHLLKKKFRQILHEIMESQRVKMTTGRLKTNIKLSTSIIASSHIKRNSYSRKNQEVEASKMFRLEESLLNRFDLIFVMKEPKENDDYCQNIVDMIVDEATEDSSIEKKSNRIIAHLSLAKTFNSVKMTTEVEKILFNYYIWCTRVEEIPKWKISMRMLEGLKRVTFAHARFMLRTVTKIIDAITTILLTEMSYPMGYFMGDQLLLNDDFFKPDDSYVFEVLKKLKLEQYFNKYEQEQQDTSNVISTILEIEKRAKGFENEQEFKSINVKVIANKEASEVENNLNIINNETICINQNSLPRKKASTTTNPRVLKAPAKKIANNKKIEKSTASKRKKTSLPETESSLISPKKLKQSEPVVNDAIIANLNSLAQLFSPPSTSKSDKTENSEVTCMTDNKDDDLVKKLEEELKALKEFDMFDDLDF